MMTKLVRIPYFHCCRSHDVSVAPTDPPPPPPPPRHHSSLIRHVTSCGCGSSSTHSADEEENHDQITKTPPMPLPESNDVVSTHSNQKKKKSKSQLRISTSSAESGLFSSEIDELEETETLICSSNPQSKKKNRRRRRRDSPEMVSPARLSVFERLIPCRVEGKIRESFAVVKKSEDPFEDFKRSMMEMIMEKEMFNEKDLEQLLHCFLSLNHRQHHNIIVEAFSQIWESLFSNNRSTCRTSF